MWEKVRLYKKKKINCKVKKIKYISPEEFIKLHIYMVIVTLYFAAPEVLNMQPYSHSADWWTLGILMYTLLVGEVSFP